MRVREGVAEAGLEVQCVGSPVNKVSFQRGTRRGRRTKLERAIEVAHRLGIRRIRIFTPECERRRRGDGRGWRRSFELAEAADVLLLVENDAKFWSAYPQERQAALPRAAGPNLMAAFDFANAQLLGTSDRGLVPLDRAVPRHAPHQGREGRQGRPGWAKATRASSSPSGSLWKDHWSGPLTLEPHLAAAGAVRRLQRGAALRRGGERAVQSRPRRHAKSDPLWPRGLRRDPHDPRGRAMRASRVRLSGCLRRRSRARRDGRGEYGAPAFASLEELCGAVDAVSVCVPSGLHAEVALGLRAPWAARSRREAHRHDAREGPGPGGRVPRGGRAAGRDLPASLLAPDSSPPRGGRRAANWAGCLRGTRA